MQELFHDVSAALLHPVSQALTGMPHLLSGLYGSLTIIAVCMASLLAGFRLTSFSGGAWGLIMPVVLVGAILEALPQLVQWSVDTAGDLSGLAGGEVHTPAAIIDAAVEMSDRLIYHSSAVLGLNPNTWGFSFCLQLAALLVFVAYLGLAALSLMALVEIWLGALVLAPMLTFLMIGSFGPAAFSPVGFVMSSALRIAGIGVVAALGATLIATYGAPEAGEVATWSHVANAIGLSLLLVFAAWSINALLVGIVQGRPGWTGMGALMAGIGHAAGGVSSIMHSIGRAGGGGVGASASGGGGGGGGSPTAAAAGTGTVHTRSTPVNRSRRA